MDRKTQEKYAELIIKTGVVLQKNQELVIAASTETVEFVRVLAEKAYEVGAKRVTVTWRDEFLTRLHYEKAPTEAFEEVPFWIPEYYRYHDENRACYVSISCDNPDLLNGIDPTRIESLQKAQGTALSDHRRHTMSHIVRWCVASYPTLNWAKKVFPDLSDEKALQALEDGILKASRVNTENPIAEWEKHKTSMLARRDYMNEKAYDHVIMRSGLGTDVSLKLPKNHSWHGCGDTAEDGVYFCPNIPTEEIYTMPHSHGVNGRVVASLPLVNNGVVIDKFWFEFKDGKIVDFDAEQNRDALESILALDEGAKRLGEIAFVPFKSPISDMNILFYNTLYDENASCHLAVGKAYPTCIDGFENMTLDELKAAGANDSITHIDFMIGTSDMEIIGVTADGQEEQIFKDGNFVI